MLIQKANVPSGFSIIGVINTKESIKGIVIGSTNCWVSGITLMQDLLENEGVEIKNNQIIDLEKYLWEPKI